VYGLGIGDDEGLSARTRSRRFGAARIRRMTWICVHVAPPAPGAVRAYPDRDRRSLGGRLPRDSHQDGAVRRDRIGPYRGIRRIGGTLGRST